MSAVISSCRRYRYTLTRTWDGDLPILVFVMLNPSKADAQVNDPTIRRCIRFAADNGYGGILVVNVFAYRATDPEDLPLDDDEACGELNCYYTVDAFQDRDVCFAWGASKRVDHQMAFDMLRVARTWAKSIKCLGKTASGAPRHPLYVKASQALEDYL